MVEKSVLVTGGNGFLGSYIAHRLVENGDRVVILDLSDDDTILNRLGSASQIEYVEGSIVDLDLIERVARDEGITHVVHLAALLGNASDLDRLRTVDVNVKGTQHLFEVGTDDSNPVERIVWASSIAVYASQSAYASELVDETDCVRPGNLYGATKAFGEFMTGLYNQRSSTRIVGLRPTTVWGPYRELEDAANAESAEIAQVFVNPAIGKPFRTDIGDRPINWVHVEDLSSLFVKALDVPGSDLTRSVYNVSGDDIYTLREISRLVTGYIPEADMTIRGDADGGLVYDIDISAAKDDLGYDPIHRIESHTLDYLNHVRITNGLERLDGS